MRDGSPIHESPPPPAFAAGDGAVWLLLGLLAGGGLTPHRDILDRLSPAEIALLRRADPAWRLPRECVDAAARMAASDALLSGEAGVGRSHAMDRLLDALRDDGADGDARAAADADGEPVRTVDDVRREQLAKLSAVASRAGGEVPAEIGIVPEPDPVVPPVSATLAAVTAGKETAVREPTSDPPRRVKRLDNGRVYDSARDAARRTGHDRDDLLRAVRTGSAWGGTRWRFTDEPVTADAAVPARGARAGARGPAGRSRGRRAAGRAGGGD